MYPKPKTTVRKPVYTQLNRRLLKPARARCFIFICLCLCVVNVSAFDFLSANGSHQFSGLIGIPQARFLAPRAATDGASIQAGSRANVAVSIQSDYSNIFAGGFRDGEFLLLDGETARNTAAIVARIGHCFQLAADFKQVNHRVGSLDNLIEIWHEIFQLPDAQRDETESNRLLFVYDSEDIQLTLDTATRSMSDTTVQFAYHSDCGLGGNALPGALWFAGINIPTGNLEDLSGIGETAVFFGLESHSYRFGQQLSAGARLGLLLPGDTEGLPEISSLIGFGNFGLQWHPHWLAQHNTRLMLQLDINSPIYQSKLRELGNYTVQLAVGGTWTPSASHEFSAAFLEDVAVDTSPDLVFHLQYQFAF